MSWTIVYSFQARQDLRSIFEYISTELCAPEAAANQANRIMQGIRSLGSMPLRHGLYADEPWRSMGLRFLPIDKYLVFYLPEEADEVVNIVRIMYGGRDIQKQLDDSTKL